ncbi:MAG: hypothetical protein AAF292_11465 [Pseudomonadota bacterium]
MTDVLFSGEFEPDPDEPNELSGQAKVLLADEKLKGARLMIRQLDAQSGEYNGQPVTATAFEAEFHPAPTTRFAHVSIMLEFLSPKHTKVLDLVPKYVDDIAPRTIEITRRGDLGLEFVPINVAIGTEHRTAFEVIPTISQASGELSSEVQWTFKAASQVEELPRQSTLGVMLSGSGPFKVRLEATAGVVSTGLAGAAQAGRDLIIGPPGKRMIRNVFEFPRLIQQKKKGLLTWIG